MKSSFSTYRKAILKYCKELYRKRPFIKNTLRCLEKAVSEGIEDSSDFETTSSVMLLVHLLTKKTSENSLMEMLSEDDDLPNKITRTTYPRVLVIGKNILKPDRLLLCVEGRQFVDVTSFSLDTVLFTLYATYYVFSIAYPQDHKDVFLFIDSVFVGLQHTAINRISSQKFIKALASLK
ncbi:uncharacterized protein LOC124451610 [Xenia sp. Carnegie-2017]|uniref:uncharacterized protein LOC124451610 n=1 Tax=Xenia sp. Carnegie-2017 TaxID=2897299 RepID=UPI001F03C758|nr:uncharacterized protein LOC124451610 [Xenia sp. Carnegie-2017]